MRSDPNPPSKPSGKAKEAPGEGLGSCDELGRPPARRQPPDRQRADQQRANQQRANQQRANEEDGLAGFPESGAFAGAECAAVKPDANADAQPNAKAGETGAKSSQRPEAPPLESKDPDSGRLDSGREDFKPQGPGTRRCDTQGRRPLNSGAQGSELNESKSESQDFPGFEEAFEILQNLSREVGGFLKADSLTLSAAESLTGGWITAAVTAVPGSSDYLAGGIVAYSNQLKERLLKVHPETLAVYGAVSAQCSKEMARGARKRLGTDIALSSTGIAGPSGGSRRKPVGLVYLTVLDSQRSITVERRFSGNRLAVTFQAAKEALRLLSSFLRPPEGPKDR